MTEPKFGNSRVFVGKKSCERAVIKEGKLKAAGGNKFEKRSDERVQGHPITMTW